MKEYYIFDFDGTLADTKQGILNNFQLSFKSLNYPKKDEKEIISTIGMPLIDAYRKLMVNLSEDKIKELVEQYRSTYEQVALSSLKGYPKLIETLEYLYKNNKKICICSSRFSNMSSKLCKKLNIDKYISCYIGSDMVQKGKPHPDQLLLAIKVLGVLDNSQAIMIGDTYFDIKMAEESHIDSCFCTYGYGSKSSLLDKKPTFTIDNLFDIINI